MKTKKIEQRGLTEIKEILKSVNASWLSGKLDNLNKYFHENMIIVSPNIKILASGKENCIQSYIDFLNRATIIDYSDRDPEVHVFGNTGIAFYAYHIFWKIDEKTFRENGEELYVFNRNNDKWSIVMRKLMPKK